MRGEPEVPSGAPSGVRSEGSLVSYDKDLPEVPGRQGEAHLPPTAYLRKREGAEGGFEVVSGRRPSKLLLVNRLREAVHAWREGGYPGASEVTKRLFSYWFEDDHALPGGGGNAFRYYFGQREAVETLAYLVEVAQTGDDAWQLIEEFGEVFYPEGSDRRFEGEDIVLETNAATGRRSIRRYVPEHGVESVVVQGLPEAGLRRHAIKAATGSGKTVVMALAVVWSFFHKKRVPGSPLSANFLVVAPNVIVYQRLERDFAAGAIFRELPLIPPEWRGAWTLKTILRGEATEPDAGAGNLFLTNVQQLYGDDGEEMTPENAIEALLGPRPSAGALGGRRTMLERIEDLPDLAVLNDEAHHVHDEDLLWNQTLIRLHETLPEGLALWLDFSATPKDQNGTYFPWVITDYPLAQAVEDRIVKAPLIVHRVEGEGPRRSVAAGSAVETYADWVRAATARYREHERIYGPLGLKPVLFVMAEKSAHADEIGRWLVDEEELGFAPEEVLVIHTRGDGEVRAGDLEKAREAVGEIDRPDNPIKAVVSVLMLREGWDVRGVTVVLGLRPFSASAKILPEQAVGRGLRLMGGLSPDRTQTLEVIGTQAFEEFVRELEAEGLGVRTVTEPPPPPVKVEPVMEKIAKDISIPLSRPRLKREYRNLSGLDPRSVAPLYAIEELEGRARVRLRMEFATTETDVHEADVDLGEPPPARELLSRLVCRVAHHARLTWDFAELYPFVRGYLKEQAFGAPVDLDNVSVRSLLRLAAVREELARHLAAHAGRATVEEMPLRLERRALKLSQTKEFTWRRNLPLLACEKTVFNYVATFNNFEKAFAGFLDGCDDVYRFAALGTTEQGSAAVFKVDYLKPSGAIGFYHPDFVVVQGVPGENGEAGGTSEVNWIVETKGRVWEDTEAKDRAMGHWCELVSEASGTPWRYARVDQAVFEGRDWSSFGELTERASGPGAPDEPSLLAPEGDGPPGASATPHGDGPAGTAPPEAPEPEAGLDDDNGARVAEPQRPDDDPPSTETAAIYACLPDPGQVMKREVLLGEAAKHLGFQELTRKVRKPLNDAILVERRAGRIRAERGRVWVPKDGPEGTPKGGGV